MKTKKFSLNVILTSVFEIIVGILLLVNPLNFTAGILTVLGIVLCILGVKSIVTYFRTDADEAAGGNQFLFGLIMLLTGGFCAIKTHWIIASFPILTVVYGVVILLTGLGKLQTTVDMLRLKRKHWYFAGISAVLSLICAVIVLMNPFSSTAVLWMFTGITLIVEAVLDIITVIFSKPVPEQSAEE